MTEHEGTVIIGPQDSAEFEVHGATIQELRNRADEVVRRFAPDGVYDVSIEATPEIMAYQSAIPLLWVGKVRVNI